MTEEVLQEKLAEENLGSISAFLKNHSAATQERYSVLSPNLDLEDFQEQQSLLVRSINAIKSIAYVKADFTCLNLSVIEL